MQSYPTQQSQPYPYQPQQYPAGPNQFSGVPTQQINPLQPQQFSPQMSPQMMYPNQPQAQMNYPNQIQVQMGYPNQPQVQAPLIVQQQQQSPSFLHVVYEPENRCCGGQPRRGQYKILVDNGEVGSLRQGQESTFPVPVGLHVISAKQGGVGGFFAKIGGTGNTGQLSINFLPGETKNARLFWRGGGVFHPNGILT